MKIRGIPLVCLLFLTFFNYVHEKKGVGGGLEGREEKQYTNTERDAEGSKRSSFFF